MWSWSKSSHSGLNIIVKWYPFLAERLPVWSSQRNDPPFKIVHILQFFQIFLKYLEIRRSRRKLRDKNDDIQILIHINMCANTVLNWMHIVVNHFQYFLLWKKKKKLMKPYLLLKLLAGYRYICTISYPLHEYFFPHIYCFLYYLKGWR